MTVIFLGSKPIGYQCLEYLLNKSNEFNIEVAGVLTRERKEFEGNNDLTELATRFGVPIIETPDQLPECDILYSVQYHTILKPDHLRRARQAAVNLHMAPLPEYRGSNQFTFALLDEKKEFGTTIHLMAPGIDNGPIIFQKRFPIPENCWVNELYERTFKESVKLFKYTLGHIISGNYQPIDQQDLVAKFGTSLHYRKEMSDLKEISLDWPKEKIELRIRATSMPGFEPPYCLIGGKKIYFDTKR